jgi:hypothetical protein
LNFEKYRFECLGNCLKRSGVDMKFWQFLASFWIFSGILIMTDTAESIALMMGFNDKHASVSSVENHSPEALCDFLIGSSGTAVKATWRQPIEAWQRSGWSQAEYCTERPLNVRTFTARLSGYRELPGLDPAPAEFIVFTHA